MAGVILCGPWSADFVVGAGAGLCGPWSADFVAGAGLFVDLEVQIGVVLCGQISLAQDFVDLEVQISWQVLYFVDVEMQIGR